MNKTTLFTGLALLILNTSLSADYYTSENEQYSLPGKAYSAMQVDTSNNFALPQQTIQLRMQYNTQKLATMEKVLSDRKENMSAKELTRWNTRIFQVKYALLFDKYLLQNPNVNPNSNRSYLNEKLNLQTKELDFYKSQSANSQLSQDDKALLHLKMIDTDGALKMTSLLKGQASSQDGSKLVAPSNTQKSDDIVTKFKNMIPKSKKQTDKPLYHIDNEGFADWE